MAKEESNVSLILMHLPKAAADKLQRCACDCTTSCVHASGRVDAVHRFGRLLLELRARAANGGGEVSGRARGRCSDAGRGQLLLAVQLYAVQLRAGAGVCVVARFSTEAESRAGRQAWCP